MATGVWAECGKRFPLSAIKQATAEFREKYQKGELENAGVKLSKTQKRIIALVAKNGNFEQKMKSVLFCYRKQFRKINGILFCYHWFACVFFYFFPCVSRYFAASLCDFLIFLKSFWIICF